MKYFSSLFFLVSSVCCSLDIFAEDKIPSAGEILHLKAINPFPLPEEETHHSSLRTEFLPVVDDVFIRWYWYKDAVCTDLFQELGVRTNHCLPYNPHNGAFGDLFSVNAKVTITAANSNGWTFHFDEYLADCVTPFPGASTTIAYTGLKKKTCYQHSNGYYFKVNVAGQPESKLAGGAFANYIYPTEKACRVSKKTGGARAVMTVSTPLGRCMHRPGSSDILYTSCDDTSVTATTYLGSVLGQCRSRPAAIRSSTTPFANSFCELIDGFWYQSTCIENTA
jgi:hypothetical protein